MIAWMLSFSTISTLPAYDCDHPKAKFVEIDLLEPEKCPDPVSDYHKMKVVPVQILHIKTKMNIKAHSCKVVYTKEVTRCGYDSINYGSQFSAFKELYELTPNECRDAVQYGHIAIYGRKFPVTLNTETTARFFSFGSKDKDGNCEYATFSSRGTQYKRSYKEVFLEITVKEVRGTIDYKTGDVKFVNGIVAHVGDKVVRDSIQGTIIWNPVMADCEDTVSEVYRGTAKLMKRKNTDYLQDSILMVSNVSTHQYAGLVICNTQWICNELMYMTHLGGGLAVHITSLEHQPIKVPIVGRQFEVEKINLQTQISHLHLDLKMTWHSRWEDMQAELCGIDRLTLHTRLYSIGDTNNPYALQDIFGAGHSIKRAGAVAYVTKCHPVEVVAARFPNCTQEAPIVYKNHTVFLDPITHIIKKYPQVVPCNTIQPVKWLLNGNWLASTPATTGWTPPHKLNLTFGTINYPERFVDGLGRGLYTEEQLRAHRLFVDSLDTRQAAVSKITNAAIGNTGRGA